MSNETMKECIEKYREAISRCLAELDTIDTGETDELFRKQLEKIRRTIRMTVEENAGYQGAPCNSLEWLERNIDFLFGEK